MLQRCTLPAAMFALCISSATTMAQQFPPSSVVKVVDALTRPDDPARSFVQTYAEKVASRLGDLDDFAEFLSSTDRVLCNLLCSAQVAPGYFRRDTLHWADLIRYVFSSTCYGVSRDLRRTALKDLDDILFPIPGATMRSWYKDFPDAGNVIIYVLGGAMHAVDQERNVRTTSAEFGALSLIVREASVERDRPYKFPATTAAEDVAVEACQNSFAAKSISRRPTTAP
jgi:hypothetical protein